MSFWSKLGLADAASFEALKEEIISLRQENERLHEAQSKYTQQLCDSCTDYMQNAATGVERRVSGINEQLKALKPALESTLRDSQQEILSAGNSHRDHVKRQLAVMLENQELFKENVASIKVAREQALSQIAALFSEMNTMQEQTSRIIQSQLTELSKVYQTISDGLDWLKENAHIQNDSSKKIVDHFDSEKVELQKLFTETQGVAEDILFLKKYSESLWEAMKLVWINELVDDARGK